jgi:hypothetical protein
MHTTTMGNTFITYKTGFDRQCERRAKRIMLQRKVRGIVKTIFVMSALLAVGAHPLVASVLFA